MKYFLLASIAASTVLAQTRLAPFDANTPLSSGVYADVTGANRNPVDQTGTTNSLQRRLNNQNFYNDGANLPRGATGLTVAQQTGLPSARLISNTVSSATNGNPASARSISDWHTFWGQFTDHDFILTPEDPAFSFPIEVPTGDPVFTNTELALSRSVGTTVGGVRQQTNLITSFIDASNTYGETTSRALALRTLNGGLLRSVPGTGDCIQCDETLVRNGNPPLVNMASAGIVPDEDLYAGGDVRVNENIALSCVHTLWVREHNRYAREINNAGICSAAASEDECIYQEARRRVVAENQAIFIGEYSELLFGDQYDTFIGTYSGFDNTTVVGCSNEFGILFRYGHTELNEQIMRMSGRPGAYTDQGAVNLNAAFFNPAMLQNAADVDYILLGNTQQRQREIDAIVSDAVRNTLFISDINDANTGGDLVARNVQRGRDHGQGSYTQLLNQIMTVNLQGSSGITVPSDFSFLSTTDQANFDTAYGTGNVADADTWVVSIAEPKVGTAGVGQTLLIVISDQYRNVRDGDMFWYENTASPNPFSAAEISELNSLRLSDVILRNSNPDRIEAMQCNAMEDGSNGATPGGVCENLNSGNLITASFALIASLFLAFF